MKIEFLSHEGVSFQCLDGALYEVRPIGITCKSEIGSCDYGFDWRKIRDAFHQDVVPKLDEGLSDKIPWMTLEGVAKYIIRLLLPKLGDHLVSVSVWATSAISVTVGVDECPEQEGMDG